MLTDFRERERDGGRKGNIYVREKQQLVASHTHPSRPNPQLRRVPSPGIETTIFKFTGQCSNQLSPTGQARAVVVQIFGRPLCLSNNGNLYTSSY